MRSANYSVVRYIADPARNEPQNVGIIIWNDERFGLAIDDAALARVVRDNPHLERDGLLYLEGFLRQQLARTVPPFTEDGFLRIVLEQAGFPVSLTQPRETTTVDGDQTGLEETLERLMKRVVRPARRRGGPAGLKTTSMLQRDLKPLIEQQRIARNFPVEARTGVRRSVDFYANSGSNIALDVVNFALSRADDIRDRADQEAFKIWDLLQSPTIETYYVLPVFTEDESMYDAYETARSIVTATGGRTTADVDEARELLVGAASPALFRNVTGTP